MFLVNAYYAKTANITKRLLKFYIIATLETYLLAIIRYIYKSMEIVELHCLISSILPEKPIAWHVQPFARAALSYVSIASRFVLCEVSVAPWVLSELSIWWVYISGLSCSSVCTAEEVRYACTNHYKFSALMSLRSRPGRPQCISTCSDSNTGPNTCYYLYRC